MAKQICCDLCGKILTKKEGIRYIDLIKVEAGDFENYPETYSSDTLIEKDLCLSCFHEIEKAINKLKQEVKK